MSSSIEQSLNEQSVYELFCNLLQNKSLEEINTKINRLKDKDDRFIMAKK